MVALRLMVARLQLVRPAKQVTAKSGLVAIALQVAMI